RADPALPGMVLSLVAVGERAGQLTVCTRFLLDYYQRVLELKQSLSRGLTYPIVVCLFIWISLGVFDGVIRGVFESLYKSAEVVLPTSMHTLFAFIHVLFLTPLLVAPLLAVGWWLARRAHWPLPGNLTMQGSTHGARGLTRHNRAVAGWAHRNPMDYTPFGRELAHVSG
ncbi:MAG: type II secretion system F family protein, partial [bacterium]|nr:type II secretion system F family protein [bacterium]